jgi:hypothetical protein
LLTLHRASQAAARRHGRKWDTKHVVCVQVLIIYLQYNFIASKLPLNWPTGLINFVGGIQVFFTSGEGIFSLDCLLQVAR